MKHLLIVLFILFGFSGFGQNRFPSVDSAKNYVLRYIKNSAVESFTNWRMQNVTYGTLELLDSIAVDGALDSIYKSGDTLKYSLGGVVYTVGVFGGITTASNGLTATSGNVKLGGSLTQSTTIDVTPGNDLIFEFGNGNIVFENDGSDVENLFLFGNGGNTNLKGGSLSFSSGANVLSLQMSDSFTGNKIYKFPSKPTTSTNNYIPLSVNGNVANDTGNIVLNTDTATVVKAYVTNAEAVTITKGQVVYIFGASGDRAAVKLAKNTSDTFSSKTLGIVRADIAAGQAGWVTTQGQVSGINLGAYTAGDILWLDSVAGGFTKTKPEAPYHSVFVGVVERANVGNGLIYVKPQNGQELGELHDTKITSPTNNQVLAYTAATDIWENKSVSTALGYTPLNVTDTAAMLSPYLRSITAPSGAGINLIKGTSQVKRLKAGTGITITDNTDSVTIASTAIGGIQWTGVDSLYAYNRAKTGFYDYSEFGGAGGLGSVIQNTSFSNTGASNTTGWDNGVNYHILTTGASATANPRFTSLLLTGLTSDWYVQNWRIYIPTLNDGTQKYYMHAGFSEVTGAAQSRAVLFVYDLDGSMTGSAASPNWQIMTANAGTRTWVTTSTAVTAGSWINLRIIVNNTAAYFYVNGSLVGTNPITTNLPVTTSSANVIYPMLSLTKTAGTTARTLWVDYHTLDIKYATER